MVRRDTRVLGRDAERHAYRFLRAEGLKPLTRNFRCRLGEIDLIMMDDDCVVFVEVRFRSAHSLSNAALTVDATKRRKLLRTADLFLSSRPSLCGCKARFDVVGIDESLDGRRSVEWVRDAFLP